MTTETKPSGVPIKEVNWVWKKVGPLTWGCRAILDTRGKKPFLDILWDRQGWTGNVDDLAARNKLGKQINTALPNFRAKISRREVPGASPEGFVVIRGVTFHYNYRYGYLWVAAGIEE